MSTNWPWLVGAGLGLLGAGAAALFVARRTSVSSRLAPDLPPGTVEPKVIGGIAFAKGGPSPRWPVLSGHPQVGLVSYEDRNGQIHGNASRRFGAPREGGHRHHVGVDLYGYEGDTVVAIEPGRIVALQDFHLGTDAVLVQHDSGGVVLYGEIASGSPGKLGLAIGSRVKGGQPIAKIGCMQHEDGECTSHMLHLETYRIGTTQNTPWYGVPPPSLLDPTRYLLRASGRTAVAVARSGPGQTARAAALEPDSTD